MARVTPEGTVKTKVKRVLNNYGAYHHWPVQNGMGSPTLDCIGCYNEKFFAIETKAPGEKPTPRQELTIEDIRSCNSRGKVFVIDGDTTELEKWLDLHAV